MLKTGEKVLGFEVLAPLGAGGMGEVYRARDTRLDREVALKALPQAMAGGEEARLRFTREAHALAALNHPRVAQIYGFHEAEGLCFLSLELVDGEDLAARLARGPLAIDEAIAIGAQTAEGLEAAHRAGIVHRDLKPGNLRITPEGGVKILDFGLAKPAPRPPYAGKTIAAAPAVEAPITQHGIVLGTPSYMSPEQARGLPIDQRTDIWAFGCVLYECLSGRRAFDGESMADIIAAILGREPDWGALPGGTPPQVVLLLRSCLEKDAARRLAHLGEARVQLALAGRGGPAAAVSPTVSRARGACESREWKAAFDLLTEADGRGELDPEGLELLAECARWTGRSEELFDPLERAHAGHVARGDHAAAVRTALALCQANGDAGRRGTVSAWWKRAEELLARIPEGPEHARYAWFCSRACGERGDFEAQEKSALRALELSRRFGDRNIEALALIDLAHVATVRGEAAAGRDLIDCAASMALGGEIDIYSSGMVLCNAIWACRCRGDWQRAQEWTDSATRWVSRQRVDYFPGLCRVHRAEVLRNRGDLEAAEKECEAATRQVTRAIPAYATFPWAELGEVRRRRGDLEGAMRAFQKALSLGWDPQPGLALLLLQQGDAASAHRSIERMFNEPRPTLLSEDRANLLGARAAIALAAGEGAIAESATAELEAMAKRNAAAWDQAAAAHARGMLELASGRAAAAAGHLTRARRIWGELEAPYELGTTCLLLGKALEADGDRTQAAIELRAAGDAFARIGAEFDRERTEEILRGLGEGAARSDGARPPQTPAPARMQREGDAWLLEFDGRAVRLQGARGLEHIAVLLARPGADCWAVDLAGPGAAADRGDAGELLDAAARESYRRRAEELQEELAVADARTDPLGAERIRSELDVIGRQLAAAVGLGGRARRAGGAVERARQSVTKGIRAAIRKIAAAHPALGLYLEATIRTGTACRFDPDPRQPVDWRVEG